MTVLKFRPIPARQYSAASSSTEDLIRPGGIRKQSMILNTIIGKSQDLDFDFDRLL